MAEEFGVVPSREGGTDLALPVTVPRRGPAPRRAVFYNPAMAFDRDVGVALAHALRARQDSPLRGWEMLAATGVRGLRMVNESGLFASLLQTEAHPEAFAVLHMNAEPFHDRGVTVREADARELPAEAPFDYVDLDPYGTPVPFLASALHALRPGGVLAVTATDMMVLAGVQPKVCVVRYGAQPVRGRLGPEGGLRILMKHVAEAARARGRVLRPLLCYVHDHHVRAYVEIAPKLPSSAPDPIAAIDAASWTGPALGSPGRLGPMWLGPLFDAELVRSMRAPEHAERSRETVGFLGRLREEVEVDRPFYYECNELARALGLARPPSFLAMQEGLARAGARSARTHARAGAFRTDAGRSVVEGVALRTDVPDPGSIG
ncbi:MAG: hypothetical protein ABSA15_03700 [Thermoplasmata archaeon]|jgi:tRNA (guanine26-N2/guanine27-N2)-dimethyltransferase